MTERAGSCWYVSPEQLLAPTDYGAGVDIWGAGCVLVEMLVGKAAFAGNNDFHQVNFFYWCYIVVLFLHCTWHSCTMMLTMFHAGVAVLLHVNFFTTCAF